MKKQAIGLMAYSDLKKTPLDSGFKTVDHLYELIPDTGLEINFEGFLHRLYICDNANNLIYYLGII